MAEKWNGFDTEKFDFNGREAIVVFAAEENRTAKWLMKTEYFGAFPNAEIELVRRGFSLAYVANETRWCNDSDVDAKADKFAKAYNKLASKIPEDTKPPRHPRTEEDEKYLNDTLSAIVNKRKAIEGS